MQNKGKSSAKSVGDAKLKAESDNDKYAFTVDDKSAGGLIAVLGGICLPKSH